MVPVACAAEALTDTGKRDPSPGVSQYPSLQRSPLSTPKAPSRDRMSRQVGASPRMQSFPDLALQVTGVGESVSCSDPSVSVPDPSVEGMGVGDPEGMGVGDSEGTGVGALVGELVGTGVGDLDGCRVGWFIVGAGVGMSVGTVVGDNVGTSLGVALGDSVYVRVFSNVRK